MKVNVTQEILNYDGKPFNAVMEAAQLLDVMQGLWNEFQKIKDPSVEEFRQLIEDFNEKVEQWEKGSPLRLREVMLRAIMNGGGKKRREETIKEKMERDSLARRIFAEELPTLTTKEAAKIQEWINDVYLNPCMAAAAHQMLESGNSPNSETDDAEEEDDGAA